MLYLIFVIAFIFYYKSVMKMAQKAYKLILIGTGFLMGSFGYLTVVIFAALFSKLNGKNYETIIPDIFGIIFGLVLATPPLFIARLFGRIDQLESEQGRLLNSIALLSNDFVKE